MLKERYEHIEAASGDIERVAEGDGDEAAEKPRDEIDDILVGDEVVVFGHAAVYSQLQYYRNHITMYDSFWMGVSFSLVARLITFRTLRWPLTSGTRPLSQHPSHSSLSSSPVASYSH